jgi:uncharacterized protein YcbX
MTASYLVPAYSPTNACEPQEAVWWRQSLILLDNGLMQVDAIYVAPVKSMAVSRIHTAQVTPRGIAGDRAFFVVDARGRVLTQREWPAMVLIRARYDAIGERLSLSFPNGDELEATVVRGARLDGNFYGEPNCRGAAVDGPFDEALTEFAGQAVRLARVDADSHAFDCHPISLCSTASVAHLRSLPGAGAIDERRFRQNVYIAGVHGAHEEDTWIGRNVRVGGAVMRVVELDPRCVITTNNPDTGERDIDTLNLIASYRTDQPQKVNFGVYSTVVTPGAVTVGDSVTVVGSEVDP